MNDSPHRAPVAVAVAALDCRTAFAPRFRRQLWMSGAAAAVVVTIYVFQALAGHEVGYGWFAAAIAGVLAVTFASRSNWRCVACERHLGNRLFVRDCPHCRAQLR